MSTKILYNRVILFALIYMFKVSGEIRSIDPSQWELFCKDYGLINHQRLFSSSDESRALLTAFVKQNEQLVPCVLQDVRANVNGNSVALQWSNKGNKSRNIVKYHVKCGGLTDSVEVEVASKDIKEYKFSNLYSTKIVGLRPWQSYRLQVCAENIAGLGKWSEPIEVYLNESPPPKPVDITLELKGKALQLKINRPLHLEKVSKCKMTYYDEQNDYKLVESIIEVDCYNSPATFYFTKDWIISNTFRDVRICFENGYGWGILSDNVESLIKKLRPSKVELFTYVEESLTSSSVELLWKRPTSNSDIVEYYEIEFQSSTIGSWDESDEMYSIDVTKLASSTKYHYRVRVSTDELCSVNIINLQSNTEYCFRICSITFFGEYGEQSQTVIVKTK